MATRAGTIELLLKAETSRFQTQMLGAERRLAGFNAKTIAAGAALVGIGSTLASSAKSFAKFEQELARAGTKIQATSKEMDMLRGAVEKAGRTTQFTAIESTKALTALGQAGLSASEQVEALPTVLDLATAEMISAEKAASIATTVMRGYGKSTNQLRDTIDLLVGVSQKANTNVSQMGKAMSFAAPIANSLGVEIEETAAVMGFLSDAGLQAGRAGRATRNMMFGVKKAADEMGMSIREGAFETHGLVGILEELEEQGLKAGDAQDYFSRRTAGAVEIILNKGIDSVRDFKSELSGLEGRTEDTADTIEDTLAGQMDQLAGDIGLLQKNIGELTSGPLMTLVEQLRKVVGVINKMEEDKLNRILTSAGLIGGGTALTLVPEPMTTATGAAMIGSGAGQATGIIWNEKERQALEDFTNTLSQEVSEEEMSRLRRMNPEQLRRIRDVRGPARLARAAEKVMRQRLEQTEDAEKQTAGDALQPDQEEVEGQLKSKAERFAERLPEKAQEEVVSAIEEEKKKREALVAGMEEATKAREKGAEKQKEAAKEAGRAMRQLGTMAAGTVGSLVSTIGDLTDQRGLKITGAALGGAGRGVQTGIRASQMATKAGGALAAASGPIGVGLGLAAAAPPILNAIFGGREEDRREKRRKRRARRRRERREFREQLAEDVSESFADEMERRQLMSQVFEIDARGAVGGTRQQIGRDIVSVIEDELSLSGNSGLGGGT